MERLGRAALAGAALPQTVLDSKLESELPAFEFLEG